MKKNISKRVTIKDIALKCGVSPSAVSLVLNERPHRISPNVQASILETAKQLNYHPNQIAVGLSTGKTFTIGLLIPDLGNSFFSAMSKSIEQQAYKLGYSTIIGNSSDKLNQDFEYLKSFSARNVDGLIVIRSSEKSDIKGQQKYKKILEDMGKPVVLIDRNINNYSCPFYEVDNLLGGYLVTHHLLSLGHQDIGILTGPINLSSVQERLLGVKKALAEANVRFNEQLLYEGDYQMNSGFNALHFFSSRKATAVFSFNDMMAFGMYKCAREAGIKIPGDISIAGFDNTSFSELLEVPLTTVKQPIDDIAKDATINLLALINKHVTNKQMIHAYEPTLIIRESTRIYTRS